MKNILTIFAGRRRFMEIGLRYAHQAVDEGIVDAVHIWNFTRDPADNAWLTSRYPTIKIYLPSYRKLSKHPITVIGTKASTRWGRWKRTYWPFYAGYLNSHPGSLVVKIDDDVLYFDVKSLERMICFHRENQQMQVVSANVVNNGFSYWKMMHAGKVPKIELNDSDNPPTWYLDSQLATFAHQLFLDGSFDELHLMKDLTPVAIPPGLRFSINFVSFMNPVVCERGSMTKDDEGCITEGLRMTNGWFPGMLACHYAFGPQLTNGFDPESEILNAYRDLSDSKHTGTAVLPASVAKQGRTCRMF